MIGITLFGCGAIGSQLAMHLASPDIEFILVDDDIVEQDNIATSAFYPNQIGINKAVALANLLYRKSKCTSITYTKTLNNGAVAYNQCINSRLAIDCFDNMDARRLTMLVPIEVSVLHIGVSRDGTGSIIWDKDYRAYDGLPRGEDTFCTHLAGRGIIRLTAVVAAHMVQKWVDSGEKESIIVTDKLNLLR